VLITITITLVSISCFVLCFGYGLTPFWVKNPCVTVRELYKSRPSESISYRRELQNLTSGLGRIARPGDLGLMLSDVVSLKRGTVRLSEIARKFGRF